MRALLFVLILAVVGLILALASGMIDVNTVRGARAPTVTATERGLAAQGGQAPAFEVETGSVAVGTGQANVTVPRVTIEKDQAAVPVPRVEVRPADGQPANSAAPR